MSLFSLFSKPKVEKARGHSEPTQQSTRASTVPPRAAQARHNQVSFAKLDRTPSALPQPPDQTQRPEGFSTRPPAPATGRKAVQWEAPPLFQAYPQATKSGVLHIDAGSAPPPKQSQEQISGAETSGQADAGSENPAVASLPKKIFILVTSGYLLQYAESGPSDRRPEKVMQLKPDSAAFACDLGPGLPYVLQISQKVDAQGAVVVHSRSIFHKLGIRGATAKRDTSKFLLVMSSAREFEAWMNAVRTQIEALGGKQARPDTAIRRTPGTVAADDPTELQKNPSQSHRYQIKRHPSRISVIGPSGSAVNSPESEAPCMPRQTEEDKTDTITIEDIEHELAAIEQDGTTSSSNANEGTDTLSIVSSSTTRSAEPPPSESLQSSLRVSTTTTVATTIVDSLANSPTTSPTSGPTSPPQWEPPRESIPVKSPHRNSSSEVSRQRHSILPMMCEKPLPPIRPDAQPDASPRAPGGASPAGTANYYFPPVPPIRRMSVLNSASDARTSPDLRARRESRLSSAVTQVEARPQSTLADPAPPSTWVPERVSGQRTSFILATSQQPPLPRSASSGTGRNSGLYQARRVSGQAFSLPLKVNPSSPTSPLSSRHNHRTSRAVFHEEVSSPVPAVHTLSAIVNPANTVNIVPSVVPPRASSFPTSRVGHPVPPLSDATSRAHAASTSLSLFLMPLSGTSPPKMPHAAIMRRSASTTSLTQQAAAAQYQAQAQLLSRRPVSLQVRSDHAPFLRNVRNSTHGLSAAPGLPTGPTTSRPIPIRSLKPSRSSTSHPTVLGNAFATESDGSARTSLSSTPLLLSPPLPSQPESAEEADVPSPLPSTRPRMTSGFTLPSDLYALGSGKGEFCGIARCGHEYATAVYDRLHYVFDCVMCSIAFYVRLHGVSACISSSSTRIHALSSFQDGSSRASPTSSSPSCSSSFFPTRSFLERVQLREHPSALRYLDGWLRWPIASPVLFLSTSMRNFLIFCLSLHANREQGEEESENLRKGLDLWPEDLSRRASCAPPPMRNPFPPLVWTPHMCRHAETGVRVPKCACIRVVNVSCSTSPALPGTTMSHAFALVAPNPLWLVRSASRPRCLHLCYLPFLLCPARFTSARYPNPQLHLNHVAAC
nr:hypothetical protein CFP56_16893 [Quercus suber]